MEDGRNGERPQFIVVAGMHAAGKTTAAKYFSNLGYLPHSEIGWSFRQDILYRDPTALTLRGPNLEWFDRSILQLELKRDVFISSFTALPHCVETWHIGNLAYAKIRSPSLAGEFEEVFVKQARVMRPLFIIFSVAKNVFVNRCVLPDMSPDTLYDFYSNIFDITVNQLDKHRFDYRVVRNDGSIGALHESLENLLKIKT